MDPIWGGGVWPPTWALFSENVCENERIGSCRGRAGTQSLDPPMKCNYFESICECNLQIIHQRELRKINYILKVFCVCT